MSSSEQFLTASEAAARLGVSGKALRLYEMRGLIDPVRTAARWRTYGPVQMARAREIIALRGLGLSLAQVAEVLGGQAAVLGVALEAHQLVLESQMRQLGQRLAGVRAARLSLSRGDRLEAGELGSLLPGDRAHSVAFELPWPWGGEWFELATFGALNFITGPLGSGKTRLSLRLAESMPDAVFVPLERAADMAAVRDRMADAELALRVEAALGWLAGEGATGSDELLALVLRLEDTVPAAVVVDLVEQGLDQPTQEALVAYLRRRGPEATPLFLMTRSTAILDLDLVRPGETILFCPANHAPPLVVLPYEGAPGREALASCLAAPEVRARTAGVVAVRPASAA